MADSVVKEFLVRVKGYLRENWGAPYVVGSMILLMSAAASLIMGSESLADSLAIYAYYSLVAGVVLQLVRFLKYNKGNREKV